MILLEICSVLLFLFVPSSIVVGQVTTNYNAYQTSFAYITSCPSNQYYDIALLQCSPCPQYAIQNPNGNKIVRRFRKAFNIKIQ
jgi:hypothetical protein